MFLLAFGCRCVRVSFGCVQRHTTARGWRVFCLRWRCRLWSCPRPLWASGGSAPCGLWFWLSLSGVGVGTCYSLPFPHRTPPQAGRARAALRAFPGHLCTFSDEIIVFCPFFQLDCLFCFLLILGALFIHSEYMHMWQGFFFFTFLSVFAFTLSVVSFKK